MYPYILLIHLLGAAIWTGGHLVLAVRFLPLALKTRSAAVIRGFEERFEPIGMTALLAQVGTGLWLARRLLPFDAWIDLRLPMAWGILAKFTCLFLTITMAIDARFRVIPKLRDDNLRSIAWHISIVTVLGVGFIAAGVSIRTGAF